MPTVTVTDLVVSTRKVKLGFDAAVTSTVV